MPEICTWERRPALSCFSALRFLSLSPARGMCKHSPALQRQGLPFVSQERRQPHGLEAPSLPPSSPPCPAARPLPLLPGPSHSTPLRVWDQTRRSVKYGSAHGQLINLPLTPLLLQQHRCYNHLLQGVVVFLPKVPPSNTLGNPGTELGRLIFNC